MPILFKMNCQPLPQEGSLAPQYDNLTLSKEEINFDEGRATQVKKTQLQSLTAKNVIPQQTPLPIDKVSPLAA